MGGEDPLEEGMATHYSILAWRIPMDRGAWWAAVHGVAESDTTEAAKHNSTQWRVVCPGGCKNRRRLLLPKPGVSTVRTPFPPAANCAGVLGELGPHTVDLKEISKIF